ncbi:MAG: LON peptidase substrate-binding domain-containing protein [Pseudomonadota bacterium]
MSERQVPLFPLSTVLYPGGPLPLRLFEARYIDMVGRCMRTSEPFGVVAISEGREVGPSLIHTTGTLAVISDFYQGSDGLLGITATGTDRFAVLHEDAADDGLRIGTIKTLPAEPVATLPSRFSPLAQMLDSILDDLGKLYEGHERQLDDASWVGYRYCEILPMSVAQKQHCLEMVDPVARLDIVAALLSRATKVSDDSPS